MIYNFSEFQKNNESLNNKFGESYKLYEDDSSTIFQNLIQEKGLNEDVILNSLKDRLNLIIDDSFLVDGIVNNTRDEDLAEVVIDILKGDYTNWGTVLANTTMYALGIGAAILTIKKLRAKNKTLEFIKSGKFSLGGKSLKNMDTKKLDDIIENKIYLKVEQPFGKNQFKKGTSCEIKRTETKNEIKYSAIGFDSKKVKLGEEILFIQKNKKGLSLKDLKLENLKTSIPNRSKNFWNMITKNLGTKFMSAGIGAGAIGYLIYGNIGQVIDGVITALDAITLDTGFFDDREKLNDLKALRDLLGTEKGKYTFVSNFKEKIESTTEFERNLNLSDEYLSRITPSVFKGKSKEVFQTSLGGNASDIGFLVSYTLADIVYELLKVGTAMKIKEEINTDTNNQGGINVISSDA